MAVVVCIPGAAESEHSLRDLTPRWPSGVVPIFHNIAGLTGEAPADHYSWRVELDRQRTRIEHLADPRVFLLGMSGGATLALAQVADCPDTVAGIGLIEPAWSFLPLSPVEQRYYAALDRVLTLPPAEQRDAFVQLLVAANVSLPPVTRTAARGNQRTQRCQETALAVVTRAMQAHQVEQRIAPSTAATSAWSARPTSTRSRSCRSFILSCLPVPAATGLSARLPHRAAGTLTTVTNTHPERPGTV